MPIIMRALPDRGGHQHEQEEIELPTYELDMKEQLEGREDRDKNIKEGTAVGQIRF